MTHSGAAVRLALNLGNTWTTNSTSQAISMSTCCAVVKETVLHVGVRCLQVAELTKTWAGKWKDMQQIIEVSGERERDRVPS